MIKLRSIFGSLIIIAMVVYFLFGNASDMQWARYDFANQSLMTIILCALVMRAYKDRSTHIIVKLFMGIALFKLLFNAYGFIDMDVFDKINNAYWTGGAIVGCIIIFLIYGRYELVKRQTRTTNTL